VIVIHTLCACSCGRNKYNTQVDWTTNDQLASFICIALPFEVLHHYHQKNIVLANELLENSKMSGKYYNDEGYRHKRHRRSDEGASSSHQQTNEHRSNAGISSIVAQHYNSMNNNDISQRQKSKIYFMRNFNNWIKSIIIRKCLYRNWI